MIRPMNIATPKPTLYDEVYYPGHVYEHTHPNLLGSLGTSTLR